MAAARQGRIVLSVSSAGSGTYDKDNAYHTVNLNPSIKIPPAHFVSAKLVSASVWNSVPNIIQGKNDWLVFDVTDSADFPTDPAFTRTFVITIAQGQYAFSDLVTVITRELASQGLRTDALTFTADLSSGYTFLSTGYLGGVVIKASPRSVGSLFGLDIKADFAVPVEPVLGRSPNRAAFNTINSFVLHSSIASPGMPINGRTNAILGIVPITSKPNRLINYTPAYPIEVNAENLQGGEISQITSYWTTEDGSTPAPMYEDFSYAVEISYFS